MDWGALGGILVGLGVPSIISYYLYRRKQLNQEHDKREKVIPLEVRGDAATTFEKEMVAARKSFDQDRALKDNTILDLKTRLTEVEGERDYEHSRFIDERTKRRQGEVEIETLKERIRELQRQLQELMDTVELMSERRAVEEREENEDSLHFGPGA